MTKAAMCTTCGQIIGPRPRQGDWSIWTWCAPPCKHTAIRWRDGYKGLLEVTSLHGEAGVAVIGLHNAMFAALADEPSSHEEWRRAHARATDAPHHLFDQSQRGCWAVLIRPGETNDVFFMPYGPAWNESLAAPTEAGTGT